MYYIRKDVNIERLWFYTTYTRVCQRNFIYLISILAKFVLFEYNHVRVVTKYILSRLIPRFDLKF